MTDAERYYRERWGEEPPAYIGLSRDRQPAVEMAMAEPEPWPDAEPAAFGRGLATALALVAAFGVALLLGYSLAQWWFR